MIELIQILKSLLFQQYFQLFNMFRQRNQSHNRFIKTSQPKFRKLNKKQTSTQFQDINTTHTNFPQFNKNNALDNSKQNLLYEKHLIKVKSACKLDQTTIVSKYLNSIRKNYDDMSKVSKRELNSMNLKKREIQFIKINNKIFVDRRVQIEKKIQEKLKETIEIKQKYEDAKMQRKTLQNIISRMKKDQIFYKQFGRIKQQQMKRRQKESKYKDEDLIVQDEKLYKLMTQLEAVKKVYNTNKQLREKKYQDYQMKIQDVIQRDKFIQERKDRTFQLRSIQLNDTLDQKNIHMRQIILAHKVADSLLQYKVNTLLKTYSDIQGAFNVVKIKTCVNQPKLLTSKFFSYQQAAQNLLQIIRQNQLKIEQLNKKKEILSNKYKNLVNEHLSSFDKENNVKNAEDNPKTQVLIDEINQKTLLMNQIHILINKKLQQLCIQHPKDAQIQDKLQILSHFAIQSFKKQNKKLSINDKKVTTMGVRMKKLVKQLTTDELSNNLKQIEQMKQNNTIEDDFLNTQRRNILKRGFSIKQINKQMSGINNK